MKSCPDNYVGATVFAALTIIGCSLSSMLSCHKQRSHHQRQLETAVQTWEDEGGAFVAERDKDDELAPHSV